MKRLNLTLLLTIFSIFFGIIGGILINAVSLPPSLKPIAWPLLGLFLGCMIILAIMQHYQQQKSHPSSFSFVLQGSHLHTRGKMLQRVERSWIRGYLEPSLFTTQVFPLKVLYQPTAIETSNQSHGIALPSTVPSSLQDLYDFSHDGLLILGGPDAGKTTALLELARAFLEQAKHDEQQPIPVVFSLASWDVKQTPLHEWLVQELQVRYEVAQQLAEYWIETDQLLPLLDDFDMVADTCRAACIQAINAYRQQHGLIPLVVCSRSTEYLAQPVRLHLRHAVVLEQLSPALVTAYTTQENQKLKPIRSMLKRYPQLLAYVRFPRLLNLLARATAEHTPSAQVYRSLLRRGDFQLVKRTLLQSYVEQQLQQVPSSAQVTPLQVWQTLHWLALGMKTQHQTLFALEDLESHWLLDKQLRYVAQQRVRVLILFIYMVVGELTGILVSQSGKIPFMTVSFVLSQIVCYRFLRMVKKDESIVRKPDLDISLTEAVSWAWQHKRGRLLKSVFRIVGTYFLIIGVGGTLLGFLFGLWKGPTFGLLSGLLLSIFAIVCFLAGGGAAALKIGLGKRPPRRPKDGIWRSARYGMLYSLLSAGVIGGFAFGMTQLLQFGLQFSPWFAIALGSSLGFNVWLFYSLINGGYALLQHYVLRSLLKKAGLVPGDLPVLLNVAVRCRLLCLINSSFMFPHRWLLDYFASSAPKGGSGRT